MTETGSCHQELWYLSTALKCSNMSGVFWRHLGVKNHAYWGSKTNGLLSNAPITAVYSSGVLWSGTKL